MMGGRGAFESLDWQRQLLAVLMVSVTDGATCK